MIPVLLSAWVCAGGSSLPADSPADAYEVAGLVVDENGEPLPGATVRAKGTALGAATNSEGRFTLRFRERRSGTLLVSFLGYRTQAVDVEQSPVKVRMEPSDEQLDEVVVTGSFVERPLKDVPVLTRVISRRDIQALNPNSLESLLQYELPGLQVGFNSMSQLPEIKYQGMDGEYILFLIDGERVSGEGADHNVDFTRFNIDDIERIEVIKGAQSTIYGSNALGGVINIITRTADRPVTANLTARYADGYGQKYTGSFGLRKNNLTTYTSLTYRTADTYTIGDTDDSYTTIWGYNIWDFTQKLGYTFNERLSADLKFTNCWNQKDIRTGRLYQEYNRDYTVGAKVRWLPAPGHQVTAGYIIDNFWKDHHFFRVDSTALNYRNIRQTPRVDYTGRIGNVGVSFGSEGGIEYLKHYMFRDSTHHTNTAVAFYGQGEWSPVAKVEIVAGLRADWHEKYKWHVTPKLSALYRACSWVTFRAGYAQGFRSPSLKELYMEYDMGGLGWFTIHGNPDLKPETSNQWSASMEFDKWGFNASLSAVHNRFSNKIEYLMLSDGSSDMQYVNAENARTTSFEAILRYNLQAGLTLTASYAYTDDYSEVDGRNTSSVRPHSVTFCAMYRKKIGKVSLTAALNGQWGAAFDTWSRSSDADAEGNYTWTRRHYDARTLVSMNVGATFPRGVYVNVGIDNLLNYKDKANDSSLQVPQRGASFVGTVGLNLADMFKW